MLRSFARTALGLPSVLAASPLPALAKAHLDKPITCFGMAATKATPTIVSATIG